MHKRTWVVVAAALLVASVVRDGGARRYEPRLGR